MPHKPWSSTPVPPKHPRIIQKLQTAYQPHQEHMSITQGAPKVTPLVMVAQNGHQKSSHCCKEAQHAVGRAVTPLPQCRGYCWSPGVSPQS